MKVIVAVDEVEENEGGVTFEIRHNDRVVLALLADPVMTSVMNRLGDHIAPFMPDLLAKFSSTFAKTPPPIDLDDDDDGPKEPH